MARFEKTYRIVDGVRRAKAAQLAGHETIWAAIHGRSGPEFRVALRCLLSPKTAIDLRSADKAQRWLVIRDGMAEEPDLFPPIAVRASARGILLEHVVFLTSQED